MTHHSSRKQFFAKLLGAAAAIGLAPKLFAKSAPAVAPAEPAKTEKLPFQVRPETRAVARRADSI